MQENFFPPGFGTLNPLQRRQQQIADQLYNEGLGEFAQSPPQQFGQRPQQNLQGERVVLEEIVWTIGSDPKDVSLAVRAHSVLITLDRNVYTDNRMSVTIHEPIRYEGIPLWFIFKAINKIPALKESGYFGLKFGGLTRFYPLNPDNHVEYYEIASTN
jgi:hypothetical protein